MEGRSRWGGLERERVGDGKGDVTGAVPKHKGTWDKAGGEPQRELGCGDRWDGP